MVHKRLYFFSLLALILLACTLPQILGQPSTAFALTSTYIASYNQTLVVYVNQTQTQAAVLAPVVTPAPCYFNWARQDLPDVTALAQQALSESPSMVVRAEAYGENCIDSGTNQIRYFGAMTTDFYLTIQMESLSDLNALTGIVLSTYNVLTALPADKLPAPPGYLDITFTDSIQSKHLRAMFSQVKQALNDDLSGEELLQALGGLR